MGNFSYSQRTKKVLSKSFGLVGFASFWQVDSVLDLLASEVSWEGF